MLGKRFFGTFHHFHIYTGDQVERLHKVGGERPHSAKLSTLKDNKPPKNLARDVPLCRLACVFLRIFFFQGERTNTAHELVGVGCNISGEERRRNKHV